MEYLTVFLILVAILALNAISAIVLIIILSSMGWWFFQPPRGTAVFKNRGENLQEIWVNVGGYKLSSAEDSDGRRWIVKTKDEKERLKVFFRDLSNYTKPFHEFLWEKFGIRFISPYWPQVYIHRFKVDRKRLEESGGTGGPATEPSLKNRIRVSPNQGKEVDNLLFVSYRPVYKQGVELAGDNSKINLLLLPTWQLVIPVTPIYYYMGNFYPLLDGAVEAGIEDFFATHRVAVHKGKNATDPKRGEFAHDTYDPDIGDPDGNKGDGYKELYEPAPLTYAFWIKLKKAHGSPIERHMMLFNCTATYYQRIVEEYMDAREKLEDLKKRGKKTDKDYYKALKEAENGEKGLNDILSLLDEITHGIYKHLRHDDEYQEGNGPSSVEKEMTKSEKLEAKGLGGEGIVPGIGFAMKAFRLVDWEAHGDTKKLAEALQAKQTEIYTAQGVVAQHEGLKKAEVLLGEGRSKALRLMIKSQSDLGVDPNIASETVREIEKSSNVGSKESSVTTWFERSGGREHPPVAIPLSEPPGSKRSKNDSEPAPREKPDS